MQRKPWQRRLILLAAVCVALPVLAFGAFWLSTWHPAGVQPEPVFCSRDAPLLPAGAPVAVLSWNVQYMAGKNHVFFYDLLDGSGPDERATPEETRKTFDEVARVIRTANPDVILLQEVDDGGARTDGEDQLQRLRTLLPPEWRCHASAFYWKAAFVPHPRIMGSVGMKLSILSKYRISRAVRHQLALMPDLWLMQQLNLKRAVLEVGLPRSDGSELAVLTTHLDAFAQSSDTMERQVAQLVGIVDSLERQGKPWVLGGDLNLLPSRAAFERLPVGERAYFRVPTELAKLLDKYPSMPTRAELAGRDAAAWHTHLPNGGPSKVPDRTIDYVFFSPRLTLGAHGVRGGDTLAISDHLPLSAQLAPAATAAR